MRQMGATGGSGCTQIHRHDSGVSAQIISVAACHSRQGVLGPGGESQEVELVRIWFRPLSRPALRGKWGFLKDDMRVGATKAKTTDAGNARFFSSRPGPTLPHNMEWFFRPRESGSWVLAMQVSWQVFMVKRQDELHHTSNPGGSF